MQKINVAEKLDHIASYWDPHIAGIVNGHEIRLAKVKGEFIWHHHADADEMFFVLKGRLTLRLRDRDIVLNPGEFFIVPRGVEHQPVAEEEVHLMLFEPAGTLNTGNVSNAMTKDQLQWV